MQPPGCTWEYRESNAEVLFVTNMWPDVERPVYGIFVQRQVQSLRQEGIRCDVLYVRGYQGFHVYVLAAGWFLLNRNALRKKYRLIHAHAGETALVVSTAIGMPKVASYCGDDILGQARPDGTFSRLAQLRRWFIKQSARFCTLTITKSQEMEVALQPSVRNDNSVIPNGVNEGDFRPIDRSEARRELSWDQEEHIVIFVATRPREPRKRLDLAQAAVAEAERDLGPIRLIVAENIVPNELPIMMNAADCMLLTSRMEGSPNAVKEALMCNLPVVSTDVGDVADLLSGVSNSAVSQDTPGDLGAALANILRSGERSDGREKRDDLKQSAIADRILGIYRHAGYQSPTPGNT
jgi:glycosyltransferase involved in cell wall biosynthesis